MMRLLIAAFCLLAVVACSSNDAKEQPQAIPAETTVATTTTVAPTTTTARNGLGVTQNYREVDPDTGGVYAGRVTVFRYRDASVLSASLESDLAKAKKRSVAIEVRICVTKSPPPPANPTILSWTPWGLGDNAGESHPAGIFSTDQSYMTIEPAYPDFLVTPPGRCRRGWIGFEIPRTWLPDFVEYAAGGQSLTWPIQK
jgi:hypothetical protein